MRCDPQVPLDLAFAALHAAFLKKLCGPRLGLAPLARVLCLAALSSATLGLAVGAAFSAGAAGGAGAAAGGGQDAALAFGSLLMIVRDHKSSNPIVE